ncbi:MAG: hypothetical protein GJV46_15405 [Geobacter sp.]|nr:hypothetical protein [Geobacter sp.]
MHALADGVSGVSGVYAYGSSSVFPKNGWNGSNYWVDVVFSLAATGNVDTTSPSVSISSPVANATVNGTASVTASASDNVAVTKVEFYVNGVLQATDTASPYTFSWNTIAVANGSFNLTAKAYDAAGNVGLSNAVVVLVNNQILDTVAPVVSSFTMPATATSLSVPVSSFTATDAVGVTGYLITESSTAPAASSSGWSATVPSSFTFSSAGSTTVYAWAKDIAGNVSSARSATVTITLPDKTAPVVNSFTMPATSTSLSVPVSSFTATDAVGVTGYLITESSTVPAASASGWSATVPSIFTFSGAGSTTVYAWAKDAAGNISSSRTAAIIITLTGTSPLTVYDALDALQIAVGMAVPNPDQLTRLDVAPYIDGVSQPDGKIDISDVIVILNKLTGKVAM